MHAVRWRVEKSFKWLKFNLNAYSNIFSIV